METPKTIRPSEVAFENFDHLPAPKNLWRTVVRRFTSTGGHSVKVVNWWDNVDDCTAHLERYGSDDILSVVSYSAQDNQS